MKPSAPSGARAVEDEDDAISSGSDTGTESDEDEDTVSGMLTNFPFIVLYRCSFIFCATILVLLGLISSRVLQRIKTVYCT